MEATFSSGWLEAVIAGIVTAVVANRRLGATQAPAQCALALAAAPAGRTAILRATLEASDSSWARLVRAALRDGAPYVVSVQAEGSYRDAPQRVASESIARIVTAERARLSRLRAIGVGAAIAAAACAVPLISAQPVLMGLLIAGAVLAAWRVLANGRSARVTLDDTARALPELVAALPPPPPLPASAAADPSPVALHGKGCLLALFSFAIGLVGASLLALLVFQMTQRARAKDIGAAFAVHIPLAFLAGFLCFLLPKIHATIDTLRGEVVFVHRLLRITYARTIVPLEIIERFFGERGTGKKSAYVGIDIAPPSVQPARRRRRRQPKPEDHVRLVDGDRVEEAAQALNAALGIDA